MEINGVTRINMTGAEIEAALMKARDLPTATELRQQFSDASAALAEGLATKQDTLEFATDADIEQAFGGLPTEETNE